MWNPFAKPKKKQAVLTLCDGLEIDDTPIPIEKSYMESNNTTEAWRLVRPWLVELENSFDGREIVRNRPRVHLLDERNAIPLPLGLIFELETKKGVSLLTNTKMIAKEKFKETKNTVEKHNNRNSFLMNTMTLVGGLMGCFILIVAIITLFQSGRLQIPWG